MFERFTEEARWVVVHAQEEARDLRSARIEPVHLLLALAGIYGSMTFQVARRAHEIGVRMALGARPARVVSMVVRRSVLLAGLGVAAGLAIALAASRLASSLLYGIAPHDPVSYAAGAAVLLLAAVAAGLLPALRAARVDPVTALRSE